MPRKTNKDLIDQSLKAEYDDKHDLWVRDFMELGRRKPWPYATMSDEQWGPRNKAKETGKIIYFNDQRGYGFVKYGAGDKGKLFFHAKQVANVDANNLAAGLTVQFNVADGQRGKEAQEVEVLIT